MKQLITNSKTLTLLAAVLGLGTTAQAQALYSTADDFAQFAGGAAVTSSAYYSVASRLNGIGNTSNPGGTGSIGSLQLVSSGGYTGDMSGSDFPVGQATLSALDPGALAPYSAGSSYGPGTVFANSGILTFDLYAGNLTDWNQFGITLNYNGNYSTFFPASTSNFTGADGRTWTQCVIDYNINAVIGGLSYFGVSIAQNDAGDTAGEALSIDNIQITAVPEPAPTAAVMAVGAAFLAVFAPRRTGR